MVRRLIGRLMGSLPEHGWRRGAARAVRAGCWLYAAVVLGLWILLFWADQWWPATLFLYGPRWIALIPLVVLLPATGLLHRRSLGILGVAGFVAVGPILGFCIPWQVCWPGPASKFRLRLLTCNADGSSLQVETFARLLAETKPDIVTLQECGTPPPDALPGEGWHVQGGDSGLALVSRFPIRQVNPVKAASGWRDLAVCYDVETPGGMLPILNVHLQTPRGGLEPVLYTRLHGVGELKANTDERWQESKLAAYLARLNDPLGLVAGDFNMPVESAIFRTYWSSYTDAFSAAGFGFGYTKFTRKWDVRIDHILAGRCWSCRRCWVGPDVGSDHRPVIADLEWIGYPE